VSTAPDIYLLDDDPSALKSLGRLLTAEGYAVRSFAAVVEFIQAAAKRPAPLAVLDFMMPGLTGLQVQQCLRGFAPDTRVIMISGTHEAAVRDQALQAGARAYLPKPFDDETFLNAVRDALATATC
jgi:FixJ family two-component response regulator